MSTTVPPRPLTAFCPAPAQVDPAALAALPATEPDAHDTGEVALPCSSHADRPSADCAGRWRDPSTTT